MKPLIAALCFAFSLPAWSTPAIDNMNAWCECVMQGGVCRVENSPPVRPGSRVFTSSGPINAKVFNSFRNDPLMCQRGVKECTANWSGAACRQGFRLMFRQTPMTCLRPGEPQEK